MIGKVIKRYVCTTWLRTDKSALSPKGTRYANAIAASFQENSIVINWVNNQSLAPILTCLGDGTTEERNIIREFTPEHERREIRILVPSDGKPT